MEALPLTVMKKESSVGSKLLKLHFYLLYAAAKLLAS